MRRSNRKYGSYSAETRRLMRAIRALQRDARRVLEEK
jgi:hypothetical protein